MTEMVDVADKPEPDVAATEEINYARSAAAPDSGAAARRTSALIITNPTSIQAEAIRGLRTRIIAQHLHEGRRALSICAPSLGAGCTFTAANLAVALAQVGVKTVLVDCDLRGGNVGGVFDAPENQLGIGDFLADEALRYADIVDSDVIPGLSLITSGQPRDNAQELLSSARFSDLVSQVLREFELAIFDTPPANACTDAQRVANVVGYSLIVARKHKSYLGDVKSLANLLRADKSVVVGTVLNDF